LQPEQPLLLCVAIARPSLEAKKRDTLRLVEMLLHLAQAMGASDWLMGRILSNR